MNNFGIPVILPDFGLPVGSAPVDSGSSCGCSCDSCDGGCGCGCGSPSKCGQALSPLPQPPASCVDRFTVTLFQPFDQSGW